MFSSKGISPRFTFSSKNFEDISKALEAVGHVVIENLFDEESLWQSESYAKMAFEKMQKRFESNDNLEASEIAAYVSGTTSFSSNPEGRRYCNLFMDMIARSGILDLYSFLLDGNVAAVQGPVLRRIDPNVFLRHIGLHADVQTKNYLDHEKNQTIYTMWTPLCDIDDHTPGLLLIDRKFQLGSTCLKSKDSGMLHKITESGECCHDIVIDINKLHNKNQPRAVLDPKETEFLDKEYQQAMKNLSLSIGDYLYAPKLNKTSVIIFRHDVVHGSFSHPGLITPRLSIDIRFMSDFVKSSECVVDELCYVFRQYQMQTYDPISKKVVDSDALESIKRLQDRVSHLEDTMSNSAAFKFIGALADLQLKRRCKDAVKYLLRI